MQKSLIYSVAVFFLLTSFSHSFGQMKIAHINTNDLIVSMPESDSVNAKLEELNQELTRTGEELQVAYNKALDDYQKNSAGMTELVRKTKEDALNDMMTRIQQFGTLSQQEFQKKQQELYQPILLKAQNAIQAVSDEQGFDYVLDTGTGAILTVPKDETMNILKLVQAKLGMKVE